MKQTKDRNLFWFRATQTNIETKSARDVSKTLKDVFKGHGSHPGPLISGTKHTCYSDHLDSTPEEYFFFLKSESTAHLVL